MAHPRTGEIQNFTPEEVMSFAQYGVAKLDEEHQEEVKKVSKEKENETTEERIARLEKVIKDKEDQEEQDKRTNSLLNTIDKAANKFELTKNNSAMAEKIKIITLAKIQQNPRLNPTEVFAEEVNSFMDIEKAKEEQAKQAKSDNQRVAAAVSGTVRGSGMPVIDKEKKFTPEDLKGTASREALRKYIESLETG